jgi:hypothetical protein
VTAGDFDLVRVTILPVEADAELVVDANAVLSGAIALEGFQAIAWWRSQIIQHNRRIEIFQLAAGGALDVGKASGAGTLEQATLIACSWSRADSLAKRAQPNIAR